jgi:hypothetical protein
VDDFNSNLEESEQVEDDDDVPCVFLSGVNLPAERLD